MGGHGEDESGADLGEAAHLPLGEPAHGSAGAFAVKARILVRRRGDGFRSTAWSCGSRLRIAPRPRRIARAGPRTFVRGARRKLFIDAQALSSVPSTEKCSALRSPFTSGRPRREDRNSCAISGVTRRSRFLQKVEASKPLFVDRQPDEPAKQHVELQPFDQMPLRADRIEKLQEQARQKALRRDGRAPDPLVRCRKPQVELSQRRIGQPPHRPQRVLRRDARLDVHVREQRPLVPRPASIPRDSPTTIPKESCQNNKHQQLLGPLSQQPASQHPIAFTGATASGGTPTFPGIDCSPESARSGRREIV